MPAPQLGGICHAAVWIGAGARMNESFFGLLLSLSLLIATTGCRSLDPRHYPTADEWYAEHVKGGGGSTVAVTNRVTPILSWHSVRMAGITDLPRPHWYQKSNPVWWFKNNADPIPPDWYRPGKKTRTTTWYLRNPFHNFDYYVIGVADHETVRSGRCPEHNMNPRGGWNIAVTGYKRLRLPFVSYERHGIAFYLGWRESGSFGAKFNFKRAQGGPGTGMADKK
jgi:hypothetical protein